MTRADWFEIVGGLVFLAMVAVVTLLTLHLEKVAQ